MSNSIGNEGAKALAESASVWCHGMNDLTGVQIPWDQVFDGSSISLESCRGRLEESDLCFLLWIAREDVERCLGCLLNGDKTFRGRSFLGLIVHGRRPALLRQLLDSTPVQPDLNRVEQDGHSLLSLAVLFWSPECFQLLLERGAKLALDLFSLPSSSGSTEKLTVLHEVARRGSDEMLDAVVKCLLSKEAGNSEGNLPTDADASGLVDFMLVCDGSGRSFLGLLVERSNAEVLRQLLDSALSRLGLNGTEKDGHSLLSLALLGKDPECFQILLERGAKLTLDLFSLPSSSGSTEKLTVLHEVARRGSDEMLDAVVKCLLSKEPANSEGNLPTDAGASGLVDFMLVCDGSGRSFLGLLVERGNAEVLRRLLDSAPSHFDLNGTEKDGHSLLSLALLGKGPECFQLLLERGAKLTLDLFSLPSSSGSTEKLTVLHEVARRGSDEMLDAVVKCLLSKEAGNSEGNLPTDAGASGLVDFMLVCDGSGRSFLGLLVERGNAEVLRRLLDSAPSHFDLNGTEKDGHSLLSLALLGRSPECFQLLLERGAKPSPDLYSLPSGRSTLLHDVARHGSNEVLDAALRSLISDLAGTGDDVLVRPGALELLEILLATDGSGVVAVDELNKRLELIGSPSFPALKCLRFQGLRRFLKRQRLLPPRLHLCGPGGAGKTLLRYQMLGESAKATELIGKEFLDGRTRGVEIMRASIPGGRPFGSSSNLSVHLFDHGGQQEFQVTYSSFLTRPLSIFVLVIPVDTTDKDHRKATNPAESTAELRYWLSLLETVAHEVNQVVVVANVFPGTSKEDRKNHASQLGLEMRKYEWNLEAGMESRLSFVCRDPIVLDASSADDWQSPGNLLEHLQEAWNAVQSNEKAGSIDLTMPALCVPFFAAISRLRRRKTLLQDAQSALLTVRRELAGLVDGLSDAAMEALLQYAEQCGEVILSNEADPEAHNGESHNGESQRLAIVVWDPNWFATAVLGEFFQPAVWRRALLRNVRMRREDVTECFRQFINKDGRAQVDHELLQRVPALLQQMRLCIPIGSRGEEWFPAFLNTAEKHTGFREADESLRREEAAASELLRKCLHVDPQHQQYQSACVCGRLLLLTDRSGKAVKPDDELRSIFPCGSFSRFQARVLEAFPDPAEEEGSACSAQPEVCKTFLSRNFVRLSWRGDGGRLCYFHSLMLHNDRGIEFAWIAWLWASSDIVDVFLEGQREGGMTTVMDQMVQWMEEASTIKRRKPALVTERLRPHAFFADKSALLDDGADSFLKPNESEGIPNFNGTEGVSETKGHDGDEKDDEEEEAGHPDGKSGGQDATDVLKIEFAVAMLLPDLKRFDVSDFRSQASIGEGAFGHVYRAVDPTNMLIALKDIEFKTREELRSILMELDKLQKAQCDHVVEFHGYFIKPQDGGLPSLGLVLSYADLGSFRTLLNFVRSREVQTPSDALLRAVLMTVLNCVATGMEFLHANGILHRDIKPENLLLFMPSNADQAFQVKFCDFGLARECSGKSNSLKTARVGTQLYMSPEVAPERYEGGPVPYSFESDCFSVGMVLNEACFVLFFPRDDLQILYDPAIELPPPRMPLPKAVSELQPIRNKCLEFRPQHRYRHDRKPLSAALKAISYEEAAPSEELTAFLASLQEYNEQRIRERNDL
eukprot:scaffold2053_cov153-Pinguiococcus_pyrenoidosus.AAC.1